MDLSPPSLRFGPFRWDGLNRLLLRDGAEIPLPPRVLALLECLLGRPGQVISRHELIERVWPEAFVTDTSLAEAVSFLRQALDDDPQSPQYLQTIHRRGYRFVAAVEPEKPSAPVADGPAAADPDGIRSAKPSIGGALVPWSLVVLLGATLIVAIWKLTHPPAGAQPRITRFELAAPPGTAFRGDANHFSVSPDGRVIAFAACDGSDCRLFVRDLRELSARRLEETTGASLPFFSPDGRSIGFFADGKLKRVASEGGTPMTLADAPDALGAAWLGDGRVVFAAHETGGLDVVSESGGVPAPFTRVEAGAGELGHRWPQWIPGTDYLIYTASTSPEGREADRAVALSLSTKRSSVITGRASAARLMSPDILVFARGTELAAARFDAVRGVLAGVPVKIAPDLRSSPDGSPLFATSAQGMLLHVPGRVAAGSFELVRGTDRRTLSAAVARLLQPALDEHAQRTAGIVSDGLRGDLWITDNARATMTRLTHTHPASTPHWMRDGQHLVFSAAVNGPFNLWIADAEGPSSRRLLTSLAHQFVSDVTANGDVVFTQIEPSTRGDIWLWSAGGHLAPLVRTSFDERDGAMSPDGQWLAYRSDESGRWQIYARRVQDGKRFVVSGGGAGRPWWLDDGRLVYESPEGTLPEFRMTIDGPVSIGDAAGFKDASVLCVAPSGEVLVRRAASALQPPVVTLEAWQGIWRALPPAVGNLPR